MYDPLIRTRPFVRPHEGQGADELSVNVRCEAVVYVVACVAPPQLRHCPPVCLSVPQELNTITPVYVLKTQCPANVKPQVLPHLLSERNKRTTINYM